MIAVMTLDGPVEFRSATWRYRVYKLLADTGRGMTVTEIEWALGAPCGGVAYAISGLVDRGLLRRVQAKRRDRGYRYYAILKSSRLPRSQKPPKPAPAREGDEDEALDFAAVQRRIAVAEDRPSSHTLPPTPEQLAEAARASVREYIREWKQIRKRTAAASRKRTAVMA